MSKFAALSPILRGLAHLLLILELSNFGNIEFRFLFPFLISFFTLILFSSLIILFILFPNKIFFLFIPNSLFLLFMWIFISYINIKLIGFNFRKIIKLSPYIRIFFSCNILEWVFKVFLHGFFLLLVYLNLNTLDLLNRNSFTVFCISISF